MRKLTGNQHYLRTALCLAYASNAAYEKEPTDYAPFERLGWDEVKTFEHVPSDTQGFVAGDSENVVLAFRGTEGTIKDWITDLSYRQTERAVLGGRVHVGFWTAWSAVRGRVFRDVRALRTEEQDVWVTGHSLGGALATLAGRNLPRSLQPTAVHTFGAPRVGDPAFARNYGRNLLGFVNEDDVVPHLPFSGLINRYEHAGRRQVILPDGRVTASGATWNKLLRNLSRVMVFGLGSLPAKAFSDHSMNRYVAKLQRHPLNRKRNVT